MTINGSDLERGHIPCVCGHLKANDKYKMGTPRSPENCHGIFHVTPCFKDMAAGRTTVRLDQKKNLVLLKKCS